MSYELKYLEIALKEWGKLDSTIREQFKKKLKERLVNPKVKSSKLSGPANRYKIKLRGSGYRLVYQVEDEIVTVIVIAVGKRERNRVYKMASKRIYKNDD
jgi:mRNA interferase RelE/StbE